MSDPQPNEAPLEAPLSSELYDEDYFLTACEGYDEFLKTEGKHLSRRLRQALEFASVAPRMRVLDVGCGRGEIVRHLARLGAESYGIDYSRAAVQLTQRIMRSERGQGKFGVARADAKQLPFPCNVFDRVLVFDVVEHLHAWELDACLAEVRRTLRPGGQIVVHTAPNRWYDAYAYPVVRRVRTLMGEGDKYPVDPRALNVAINTEVHVNEQDMLRIRRVLTRAKFRNVKVWLDTPPQNRDEGAVLTVLRHIAFNWVPFAWFFQREVFAVGMK